MNKRNATTQDRAAVINLALRACSDAGYGGFQLSLLLNEMSAMLTRCQEGEHAQGVELWSTPNGDVRGALLLERRVPDFLAGVGLGEVGFDASELAFRFAEKLKASPSTRGVFFMIEASAQPGEGFNNGNHKPAGLGH